MPILAALAALIAIAAAVSIGQQLGHDAGFLIQLGAVPAIALVLIVALWLYHRRRAHELIVARYELRGDALGWRRVRLGSLEHVRVCAECGAIVPDFKAQELHAQWHEDLAELVAGRPLEPAKSEPWSAITEPGAAGPEPEPAEPEPIEQPGVLREALRQTRDVLRIRRPAEPEQLEPAEPAEVGEWEARARAFRAGMEARLAEDRDHADA